MHDYLHGRQDSPTAGALGPATEYLYTGERVTSRPTLDPQVGAAWTSAMEATQISINAAKLPNCLIIYSKQVKLFPLGPFCLQAAGDLLFMGGGINNSFPVAVNIEK